jgi:putative spermidine/putrescine transport system substrate-binding protein
VRRTRRSEAAARAAAALRAAGGALAALAATQLAAQGPAPGRDALTVLTWGGAYEASQRAAYFEPFERATGIDVRIDRYDGGIEGLRAQAEGGGPGWDVVDLVAADARAACRAGLLAPLEPGRLEPAPDGTPVLEDFDDGAFTGCAVAQLTFSTVIAFDVRAFPGEKPRTVADFFDVERFPGRRALRCAPVALLEWALLAYGVPPAQVYDLLSTERGLDLAFRQLDVVRPHLVWWRGGDEPARMLAGGEVAMASGYNGRFFHAQVIESAPIAIIWDGQLVDHATWAIPRNAPSPRRAMRFIRFATHPERMADQAMRISYAPTRASARRRVGLHVEAGVDMSDHLPTSGSRMGRAIREDSVWYARTEALRARRFAQWLGADRGCPGSS